MDTRENYCQFSHLLLPRINFCFANVFFQSNSSAIPANPGEAGGRNAPLSHFAVTGGFKAPQGSGRRHEQDQQPWTSLDKWSLWAGRTRTAAPQPPRGAPGASEAEGKPRRGGPDPHTHPAPRRMGFGGPGSPWLTLPLTEPSILPLPHRQQSSIPRPGYAWRGSSEGSAGSWEAWKPREIFLRLLSLPPLTVPADMLLSYATTVWTQPCALCSGVPLLEQGGGAR